jgi:hypothetical protein
VPAERPEASAVVVRLAMTALRKNPMICSLKV